MPPRDPRRSRCFLATAAMASLISALPALAMPANDDCAGATLTALNTPVSGTAAAATPDGSSLCSVGQTPDVYHRFTTTVAGIYTVSLCNGTTWDTAVSLHTGCPAIGDGSPDDNHVACADDECDPGAVGTASLLRTYLPAATTYIVRIAAYDSSVAAGTYGLLISSPPAPTGACCAFSACSVQTQLACTSVGGTYLGDRTACQTPSAAPQTFTATGTPVAIPDDSPVGVSRTINVPAGFTVADVRVAVGITHPFLSDLRLTLSKGSVSVPLMQSVGGTDASFDFDLAGTYTFSDAAAQTAWERAYTLPADATVFPAGSLIASDALGVAHSLRQAFAGSNAQGNWTLTIADVGLADMGTLDSVSLVLESSTGERCVVATGACCTGTPQGGLGTTCAVTTQASCAGSFRGPATTCGPAGNPIACCKANYDRINGLNIDDIFIFLNAWFAGAADTDFDGVNGRNIDDIFIFLNAWFAGCPS